MKSPVSMSVTSDEPVEAPARKHQEPSHGLPTSNGSDAESDRVDIEAASVFARASEVVFEDGMESSFSRSLIRFVQKCGDDSIRALATLIDDGRVDREAAGEALRWLGRMVHPPTHESRRNLLETCLFSTSVAVRDGAVLGLTAMGDPHAISYLQRASEHHGDSETRCDMEQAIGELQSVGT